MSVESLLRVVKLAVLVLLAAMLFEARLLLRDARTFVSQTSANGTSIASDARHLIATAQLASDEAVLAEKEQIVSLRKTSLEVYKTTAAARLVLVRLDHSLNDQVAPQLAKTLADTDAAMLQATKNLDATTEGLKPTLENLAAASKAAADSLADPSIKESLQHVDELTAQTAATAANINLATHDIRQVTEKVKNDYLKPQKFAWSLLKELAGLGGNLAQVFK